MSSNNGLETKSDGIMPLSNDPLEFGDRIRLFFGTNPVAVSLRHHVSILIGDGGTIGIDLSDKIWKIGVEIRYVLNLENK